MTMLVDILKTPKHKQVILQCLENGGDGEELYKILHDAKVFYVPNNQTIAPAIISLQKNLLVIHDLFRLPHSPMVIETLADNEGRIAIYLWKTQGEGYEGLYFEKVIATSEIKCPVLFGFDPKSLVIENGSTNFACSMAMLEPDKLTPMDDELEFLSVMITIMCYVSLINSPNIIELETVDLAKLNKKRLRNQKEPLTNYSVIKLQKHIKEQLKGVATGEGVSFHWRRGHFKAKPKGLTWWSPHTVGDKKHGETKSAYLV